MNKSLLIFLTLTFLALPAQAEIYKCRLANGKTEISNAPCPSGAGTLAVRPDETVSEESRREAERDVERMRGYVEKRATEKQASEAAEREQQLSENQAIAQQRVYQSDNMEECLTALGRYALEAGRRAELEAICRAKPTKKPVIVTVPTAVPLYPVDGRGYSRDGCTENVMRLRLSPAEQNRRLAQCRGNISHPPPLINRPILPPNPRPVTPSNPRPEIRPGVPPCPLGKNNCR